MVNAGSRGMRENPVHDLCLCGSLQGLPAKGWPGKRPGLDDGFKGQHPDRVAGFDP